MFCFTILCSLFTIGSLVQKFNKYINSVNLILSAIAFMLFFNSLTIFAICLSQNVKTAKVRDKAMNYSI